MVLPALTPMIVGLTSGLMGGLLGGSKQETTTTTTTTTNTLQQEITNIITNITNSSVSGLSTTAKPVLTGEVKPTSEAIPTLQAKSDILTPLLIIGGGILLLNMLGDDK